MTPSLIYCLFSVFTRGSDDSGHVTCFQVFGDKPKNWPNLNVDVMTELDKKSKLRMSRAHPLGTMNVLIVVKTFN